MPVGTYGGRADVMQGISPLGPVYQASTLSGNPVAMAARLAQLRLLRDHPEWYTELETRSDRFFREFDGIFRRAGVPHQINHIGSLGSVFFTDRAVMDDVSAKTADTEAFAAYARAIFRHGFMSPRLTRFEALFLSTAHTEEDLDQALSAMEAALS